MIPISNHGCFNSLVIHDLGDIWGYRQRAHSGSVLGIVTTKMQMQERTALFSTNGHSAQSAAHVTGLSVSMKRKGPLLSHILQSSARIRAAYVEEANLTRMWICCTSIERKIRFAALEVVVNLVHGDFAFFLLLLGGYELWIIFYSPQPSFEELLKANSTVSTLLRQTIT